MCGLGAAALMQVRMDNHGEREGVGAFLVQVRDGQVE